METVLPESLVGWVGSLAGILAAVAAGFGYFDKGWRAMRATRDEAADGAIKLLKEHVAELERRDLDREERFREMSETIDMMAREVINLKEANKLLAEILQGRDEATVTYRQTAAKAYEAIHAMAGTMDEFKEFMDRFKNAKAITTCPSGA